MRVGIFGVHVANIHAFTGAWAAALALACDPGGSADAVSLRAGTGDTTLEAGSSDGGFFDLWEGALDETGTGGGEDTGGGDDGPFTTGVEGQQWPYPIDCQPGEFKIFIEVELRSGAQGSIDISSGTLFLVAASTDNGVVSRSLLACIDPAQLVGPNAPGVRLTATAGADPGDYVVGMRRGIDHGWISKCVDNTSRNCWIDAKFDAQGKNTLKLVAALVLVKFDRKLVPPKIEKVVAPMTPVPGDMP